MFIIGRVLVVYRTEECSGRVVYMTTGGVLYVYRTGKGIMFIGRVVCIFNEARVLILKGRHRSYSGVGWIGRRNRKGGI